MVVGVLVAATTATIPATAPVWAAPSNIAGMVVFIDPGHNGANDASISRQVPTGRGGTKDCQASGTSTNNGYPEHTFTWDTALRVRAELNALGVRTAMSRGNDNALGPCVDERANMANALHPNAILSIHADGGPAVRAGFPRQLFGPAAQPGAGRTIGAVRPRSCATRCRPRAFRRPATSARTACMGARTWPG